jgi:hypothetical protein
MDKYLKYKQKYKLLQKNYDDIKKIKNHITLTQNNIKYFCCKSEFDKKILKYFAKKYKHDELYGLLNSNIIF